MMLPPIIIKIREEIYHLGPILAPCLKKCIQYGQTGVSIDRAFQNTFKIGVYGYGCGIRDAKSSILNLRNETHFRNLAFKLTKFQIDLVANALKSCCNRDLGDYIDHFC
jgi:hypothetical protein